MNENYTNNFYILALGSFVLILPLMLYYIRRFLPKKIRIKMEQEEACNLELHQKPQMKRVRKYAAIGFIFSLLLIVCISYFFKVESKNITWILIITLMPIAIYAGIAEQRIKKGKSFLDFYDKKDFFKLLGVFSILTFVITFIFIKLT